MKLTVLGCYAATPRSLSNPTSQVLESQNQMFLIDCGEATQVQLRRRKVKFSSINQIFISHLHGDHFYGLPGLITTFNLLGRLKPLHIYAPKGAKRAIETMLKISESKLRYELLFYEQESLHSEKIFEDEKIEVYTIPLIHRVYTNGYLFREKPYPRKLNIDAVNHHGIDRCYFQNIKDGKDYLTDEGIKISNDKLTFKPSPSKSYAFCSDTAYNESVCDIVEGVDLLYHESTFLEEEVELAKKTKHSTAIQAAHIAKKSKVKKLLLGHYSTRYSGVEVFKKEALNIFPQVLASEDGMVIEF